MPPCSLSTRLHHQQAVTLSPPLPLSTRNGSGSSSSSSMATSSRSMSRSSSPARPPCLPPRSRSCSSTTGVGSNYGSSLGSSSTGSTPCPASPTKLIAMKPMHLRRSRSTSSIPYAGTPPASSQREAATTTMTSPAVGPFTPSPPRPKMLWRNEVEDHLERSSSDLTLPLLPHISPLSSNPHGGAADGDERSTGPVCDPQESLKKLEKALKRLLFGNRRNRSAPAGGGTEVAALYNEIGNSHFRLGRWNEAENSYKKAVEACDFSRHQINGKEQWQQHDAPLVAAYSNLATLCWRQGKVSVALDFLQQSWAVHELATLSSGKSMEDSATAADIAHQFGLCHALLHSFDRALFYLEKARSIRVRLRRGRRRDIVSVGRTLDAIGKVHWMRGDYAMAMHCHTSALRHLTEAGADASVLPTLQNMAHVHVSAHRYEAAIAIWCDVLALHKKQFEQVSGSSTSSPGTDIKLSTHIFEALQALADLYTQVGLHDKSLLCRQEAALWFHPHRRRSKSDNTK